MNWFKRTFRPGLYQEKRKTRNRVRLLKLQCWCKWAKDLQQLKYVRDAILAEKYEDPTYSELARALNRRQSELYGLMFQLLRPTDEHRKFEKSW